jgi:REP element-mobilizing transposase RayT
MNRGVDRQPVFLCDQDRVEMGRRLADVHDRFDVTTLAYCLMGNHLHLVLRAPDQVLPEAMHHLTSVYSHRFNARHHRDGPLFRGRYHSIPVEDDGYLLWVARYIHRNPLDIAGIVTPRAYRWSSYRTYLGLRPSPAFLDRRPVMDLVGGRVAELQRLTEEDATADLRSNAGLTALVRCARAVEDEPDANLDRTLLILLQRRTVDLTISHAIDGALGPRSEAAAVRARQRAEVRRRKDPTVARMLTWIERQLTPVPAP